MEGFNLFLQCKARRLAITHVVLVAATAFSIARATALEPRQPSESPAVAVAATEVATSALPRQSIPGSAIAIVRNGQVIFDQGYGLRDIASHKPVDSNTIFEIGSITKQFTAAATSN